MNSNYIALLIAIIALTIQIIRYLKDDWINSDGSALLFLVTIATMLLDIKEKYIIVISITIILLLATLTFNIVSIHLYRKHNNLINYAKKQLRRDRRIKVLKILIPIMIAIKILYEIEIYFHLI